MAQRSKNENLKNTAREHEGNIKVNKKREEGSTQCPHSLGLLPHLVDANQHAVVQKEMTMDRMAVLRRIFKSAFGYKPVGMTESQIEEKLRSKNVDLP